MWCLKVWAPIHFHNTRYEFGISYNANPSGLTNDSQDQQKNIQNQYPDANISNNDIIGSFSYNIFAGVFVATIFGAAFFFDLFWPERRESKSVQWAWKICSVLSVLLVLASAINLTVIISTHQAYLSDPTGSVPQSVRDSLKPVLNYGKNGEAIASVVLLWIGWLFTIWAYVFPPPGMICMR